MAYRRVSWTSLCWIRRGRQSWEMVPFLTVLGTDAGKWQGSKGAGQTAGLLSRGRWYLRREGLLVGEMGQVSLKEPIHAGASILGSGFEQVPVAMCLGPLISHCLQPTFEFHPSLFRRLELGFSVQQRAQGDGTFRDGAIGCLEHLFEFVDASVVLMELVSEGVLLLECLGEDLGEFGSGLVWDISQRMRIG